MKNVWVCRCVCVKRKLDLSANGCSLFWCCALRVCVCVDGVVSLCVSTVCNYQQHSQLSVWTAGKISLTSVAGLHSYRRSGWRGGVAVEVLGRGGTETPVGPWDLPTTLQPCAVGPEQQRDRTVCIKWIKLRLFHLKTQKVQRSKFQPFKKKCQLLIS